MDYVSFLKSRRMIGQLDPWKLDDGTPVFGLLVSVDIALAECIAWSTLEMSRAEFLKYLKEKDILVLSNIEDFVNWKKDKVKPSQVKGRFKRKISEERRKHLQNHAKEMREKLRPTILENA